MKSKALILGTANTNEWLRRFERTVTLPMVVLCLCMMPTSSMASDCPSWYGNVDDVRHVMSEYNMGPNDPIYYMGRTPLHCAALYDDSGEVVRMLLNLGGDPNVEEEHGGTPLYWAVLGSGGSRGRDNSEVVKMLLNAGADPNAHYWPNSGAPLHSAVASGSVGVVKLLLNAGADPNAKINDGYTPLYLAEYQGHNEIVALLCASGAACAALAPQCLRKLEFDGADARFGNVCTDMSIRIGYFCQRYSDGRDFAGATDVLPPGGEAAIPHPCADRSEIPGVAPHLPALYHMACGAQSGTPPAPQFDKAAGTASCGEPQGGAERLKQAGSHQPTALLDETALGAAQAGGGCVWTQYEPGMHPGVHGMRDGGKIYVCPLHDAAAAGDMRQVRAMLSAGADANAAGGGNSQTPLHHAAREGHVEVARTLLEAGAAADARDGDGCTPLHWAAQAGQAGTAGTLLGGGASADARCGGLDETALLLATKGGHIEAMRALLGGGANADLKDRNMGSAALHYAASQLLPEATAAEAAKVLLQAGANANVRNDAAWTPLHVAVREGYAGVMRALLKGGADTNAQDRDGGTPLHRAVWEDRADAVQVLLEAGVPANPRDRGGRTPYDWAERHGSRTVQDLLLAAGGGAASARSAAAAHRRPAGAGAVQGCSVGELKCENGAVFACVQQYGGGWGWQVTFDACAGGFGGSGQ